MTVCVCLMWKYDEINISIKKKDYNFQMMCANKIINIA